LNYTRNANNYKEIPLFVKCRFSCGEKTRPISRGPGRKRRGQQAAAASLSAGCTNLHKKQRLSVFFLTQNRVLML